MKHLLLTGDETRRDIEMAITGLRERRSRAVITSTRDELDADIDELVELWMAAAR